MTAANTLRSYLPRLRQPFDQGLRTDAQDATLKGWGQFVSAEHHSRQIGLYGTCAGVLVKSIGDDGTHIEPGVIKYLEQQWSDRGETEKAQKYFGQTVRLSFLVMALAKVQQPKLRKLRDAAARELVRHQSANGAWGDWLSTDGPSPRPETTAWAVLALLRLQDSDFNDNVSRAARYLQAHALSFPDIAKSVDPVILSAVTQALAAEQLNRRTVSAAISVLSRTDPADDLYIYFFDYLIEHNGTTETKRDYLCVPRFYAYSLLVGSESLFARARRLNSIRFALAHQRAIEHLNSVLQLDALRTPRSRYPATMDQAFVALSVEQVTKREPEFASTLEWLRPAYQFAASNFFIRVVLPLSVLGALGVASRTPKNLAELVTKPIGLHAPSLIDFATRNEPALQFTAFALTALLGQPMLSSIFGYFRKKWAP